MDPKWVNAYNIYNDYAIHVKSQNVQCFVLEYVVDHIIKNVIKKYLLMMMINQLFNIMISWK